MKNLVLLVALASPTALTSMSSEPLVAGGHSFQPFLVSLTPCPPAHLVFVPALVAQKQGRQEWRRLAQVPQSFPVLLGKALGAPGSHKLPRAPN